MSVAGIEALTPSLSAFGSSFSSAFGSSPYAAGSDAAGAAGAAGALGALGPSRVEGPTGPSFGQLLAGSIEGLEGMQDRADNLSVQAATGDLDAIHEYTVAATETKVATELTVAVRNKAVEAFNEILRMQV